LHLRQRVSREMTSFPCRDAARGGNIASTQFVGQPGTSKGSTKRASMPTATNICRLQPRRLRAVSGCAAALMAAFKVDIDRQRAPGRAELRSESP
jgi:hypothetical protein